MANLDSWFDIQKIIWAIGGSTATLIFGLYRGKTKVLPYQVTHSRVGVTANDKLFGDVKVTLGDTVIPNLWLTEVRLENITLSDFEKLNVAVWSNDSKLLGGMACLDGVADTLKYSESMEKQLALSAGVKPISLYTTPGTIHP
ncbi:MAG: hypothetical protein ACREBU_17000, partial [Nitrososphaera sp.]